MSEMLPLFPISSQILPGGYLPLRIFEDKYLRMIKESFDRFRGIGIVMLDNKADAQNKIMPIGTRAEIIDFYTLADGLLGVTVMGVEKFKITDINVEPDGLKVAEVSSMPNWQQVQAGQDEQHLINKLKEVFENYPELDELYEVKPWQDISWTCQRWLEILPMPIPEKQALIASENCEVSRQFLRRVIRNS